MTALSDLEELELLNKAPYIEHDEAREYEEIDDSMLMEGHRESDYIALENAEDLQQLEHEMPIDKNEITGANLELDEDSLTSSSKAEVDVNNSDLDSAHTDSKSNVPEGIQSAEESSLTKFAAMTSKFANVQDESDYAYDPSCEKDVPLELQTPSTDDENDLINSIESILEVNSHVSAYSDEPDQPDELDDENDEEATFLNNVQSAYYRGQLTPGGEIDKTQDVEVMDEVDEVDEVDEADEVKPSKKTYQGAGIEANTIYVEPNAANPLLNSDLNTAEPTTNEHEKNSESKGPTLNVEHDKDPLIDRRLLAGSYMRKVITHFFLHKKMGQKLCEVNSEQGCLQINLRNNVSIKDYFAKYSVESDSPEASAAAAVSAAKMKGWKSIKVHGDAAYVEAMASACKSAGISVKFNRDYGNIADLRKAASKVPNKSEIDELKAKAGKGAMNNEAKTEGPVEPAKASQSVAVDSKSKVAVDSKKEPTSDSAKSVKSVPKSANEPSSEPSPATQEPAMIDIPHNEGDVVEVIDGVTHINGTPAHPKGEGMLPYTGSRF
ncbi:hypothetical protein GCM10011607_12220 [Shewanella inventionis]|uniref:Large polyvalent protein-associated domain-containing protein n=1 Tax=Shewanella inventionis TaxID=1738770 RepID=A0ABQ1IVB1_9GAMM|nr:LPD7 domain-containing protein [Shewanella inventionis]GGB53245.1 hypothetical protein GCM10011607_12220 [Shewanella inventionis]